MLIEASVLSKIYLATGLVLPMFYIQQVVVCMRDQSRLHAFSMSKATTQLLLRLSMIPFLLTIDSREILCIALLDLIARFAEVFAAISSLRRQEVTFDEILHRSNPFSRGSYLQKLAKSKDKRWSLTRWIQSKIVRAQVKTSTLPLHRETAIDNAAKSRNFVCQNEQAAG